MKTYEDYLVNENASIKEALVIIKNNKSRHALLATEDSKIVGIVSEGDIINALLKGSDLLSKVAPVANKSFIYLSSKDANDRDEILLKLHQGILIIPVLNEHMNLIEIINYMDYLK